MILATKHTKSQQIINALEENISSGKLSPGQRLQPVRTIAQSFSTSVSVVNNALNVLERQRLVTRKPRCGVFVRDSKPKALEMKNKVLLCMPTKGHLFQNLFSSIFAQLHKRGLTPIVVDSSQLFTKNPDPAFIQEIHNILGSDLKAALIFGHNYWMNPILKQYPDKRSIFLFEIDISGKIPGSAVLVDYEAAMYQMTSHLASLGRKRIMLCASESAPSDMPVEMRKLHHYGQIFSGYERALREHSLASYNESLATEWDIDINKEFLDKIMNSPERPDAIMCYLDSTALKFITAAERLGIKVPDDLAITGFFNTPWSDYCPIKITTVTFDWEHLSELAAEAVISSPEQKIIYLKPELIIKQSCGGKCNHKQNVSQLSYEYQQSALSQNII